MSMEKILVTVCGLEILVMDEKTAGCVVEYDMRLKDAFAWVSYAFGYYVRLEDALEIFEGMVKVYRVCVYRYPYACAFWVCVVELCVCYWP